MTGCCPPGSQERGPLSPVGDRVELGRRCSWMFSFPLEYLRAWNSGGFAFLGGDDLELLLYSLVGVCLPVQ